MATQTESAGPSAGHSQAHAYEAHVRATSLGKRFPITAFGICLGLAGSSICGTWWPQLRLSPIYPPPRSRAMVATRDELRLAARQHAERGLRCSAKWVAELLVSIARDGQADAEMLTEEEEDEEEQDRVLLAKAYFDTNEFQRAAHALEGARGSRGRFLRWYSLFLVGEKRKEEETLEEVNLQLSPPPPSPTPPPPPPP